MTLPISGGPVHPRPLSRRSALRVGAVALAAGLTLTACGGGSGSSATSGAGPSSTLTIAVDADAAATGYDPLLYSQGQYQFFSGMYDALFVTDATGAVQPNLVTEFENNSDNTVLTMTLKDGVTFTDGSTLDAALVKANLDRRTDTDLAAYGQLATGGASEISDVTVKDAKTVVITWKAPQASGQNALADEPGVIVGKTAVENPESLATTPVGSGPYTLDTGKTTRASSYTLVKNDKAWNKAAFPFSSIVFKVIIDDQALANAVISGQADVATQLGADTVEQVKARQKVVGVGGTIVGFPVTDKTGATNPAFASAEVRQALGYAIDRATIVKDLHPASRATSQLFPQSAIGFDAALDTAYAYDPAKAKQLLADAGFADGFTIDMTVGGQPSTDQIAVQKQWEAIGVKLNFITATSTDAVFAAARTEPMLFGPFGVGNHPEGFVAGVLVGGFMNLQKATDADIEGALGAALGTTGADQEAALKTLNAAITEKAWYLPIYEDFLYAGYNPAKVSEPKWAGTNAWLVLPSITPAG